MVVQTDPKWSDYSENTSYEDLFSLEEQKWVITGFFQSFSIEIMGILIKYLLIMMTNM